MSPQTVLDSHPRFFRIALRLVPVAMVVNAASFAIAGYVLIHRNHADADARARVCRVAESDRTVLRNLLTLAQRNSRIALKSRPDQLARAQAFYLEALGLVRPVDCRSITR